MDSDLTQSAAFMKLYAWVDARKTQVTYGVIGAIVLALVIYLFLWQRAQKAEAAAQALSAVHAEQLAAAPGTQSGGAAAYLRVVSEYSGSSAAARAKLLAAGALFTEGKYAEAEAQFRGFTRDHSGSPFMGQALLGIASSLEAQGKTAEAVTAYNDIVQRRSTDPVIPQAKFSLARLHESQKNPEKARDLYEEILNSEAGMTGIGSEAGMRLEELRQQHPEWAKTNAPAAALPQTNSTATSSASTSAPPAKP